MTTVTFEQLPARLDLHVGLGDDLSLLVDFDIVLTGYTFAGAVVKGGAETALTINSTSLATGQITIVLTDAQITALGVGTFVWYLTWTVSSASRRVLAGEFKVLDKQ
jgi:hypothetical protein